ncbi:unnamed protein product [Acanthosepion pharaonis]|uniref:Transmembrane protein n=1 Tax=Acanthosepion pharaonis TaxID=158019 RepID=A0A812DTM3_ACAPH|nr:unnamed protein product [Sepia pharaonis]
MKVKPKPKKIEAVTQVRPFKDENWFARFLVMFSTVFLSPLDYLLFFFLTFSLCYRLFTSKFLFVFYSLCFLLLKLLLSLFFSNPLSFSNCFFLIFHFLSVTTSSHNHLLVTSFLILLFNAHSYFVILLSLSFLICFLSQLMFSIFPNVCSLSNHF